MVRDRFVRSFALRQNVDGHVDRRAPAHGGQPGGDARGGVGEREEGAKGVEGAGGDRGEHARAVAAYGAVRVGLAATRMAAARTAAGRRGGRRSTIGSSSTSGSSTASASSGYPTAAAATSSPTPSRGWRGWPSSTSTATARSRRRTSRSSTRAWRKCTRSVGCPAATEGRTPRHTCCCAVRWSTIRKRASARVPGRPPRGARQPAGQPQDGRQAQGADALRDGREVTRP